MDSRLDEIRRTFTHHPQRAGRILARLRHAGADLDHLTEMDLAEDPRSGFTDQNHVGGRALAVALGARLGLRREMRVLDACCGIGGTCRVLADSFGCRTVGIEITPARCRDAVLLSERVGLAAKVRIVLGDACALPFGEQVFDAVLGQSAWSHVTDKPRLLAEATRVLRNSGVLAFEDAVRGPCAGAQEEPLGRLARYWCFSLESAAAWQAYLEAASLCVEAVEDLTCELEREAQRALDYVRRQYGAAGTLHRERWTDVLRLIEAEALRYVRLVARRA
jgi:ubiquinone/menaquinone biosynthesis C-methylase UbiE